MLIKSWTFIAVASVCTGCLSRSRIPQGFLPQLAGHLDGSNLLLFKQRGHSWTGLCWLLGVGHANTLNFLLLIFLQVQCCWKHRQWNISVVCLFFAVLWNCDCTLSKLIYPELNCFNLRVRQTDDEFSNISLQVKNRNKICAVSLTVFFVVVVFCISYFSIQNPGMHFSCKLHTFSFHFEQWGHCFSFSQWYLHNRPHFRVQ